MATAETETAAKWGARRRAAYAGLVVLLAATLIVFASFASVYLMQRSLSMRWTAVPFPASSGSIPCCWWRAAF